MKRYAVHLLIGVSLVSFFLFSFVMDDIPGMQKLKASLQTDKVSSGILDYGAMGLLMKKLHLVTFADNDDQRYIRTTGEEDDLETMTFQKKRQVGDYLYKVNKGGDETQLSTKIAQQYPAKKNWPVISISIDEDKLYDPETGIIVNSDRSGRDWERLAEVTYIENGEVKLQTHAGLRVHGGQRLVTKRWNPGFKLYFRKKYGVREIPGDMFFPGLSIPVRTLVLKTTDWPPGYPMNNPLAYDIAREINCLVPQTRLVEVLVNGKSQGMSFAVEHLSRRQWGQRFGHDNYNFYKFRSEISLADEKMYHRLLWAIVEEDSDLSAEEVGQTIDLDNLSRHLFSWVFCGTTDYCQGVAFYDNEDPNAKLSWINWDMDHSFFDLSATRHQLSRENWQQNAFEIVYRKRHDCGRTKLFSRLMDESPEFRLFFLNLFTELLNHRLTHQFLTERVDYYADMMQKFGEPHELYVSMLREFMANRPGMILAEAHELFDMKGPYLCRFKNPENHLVIIDGYSYSSSYEGHYFDVTPVRVHLPPEQASRLKYWLVNGERVISAKLELTLGGETEIEAVLRPSSR